MVSIAENTASFAIPVPEENEDRIEREILETENDVENLITATTSENTSVFTFKSVDTTYIVGFQMFVSLGMMIVAALLPYECENRCAIKPLSILFYLHCLFWGLFLVSDQYIQYQHIKVRRRGYLQFYNDTRTISQLPFWIVSTWSTFLLTVATVLHDHCNNETQTCEGLIRVKKSAYVTLFIGIEAMLLIIILTVYLYRVIEFNKSQDPPDVLRDDMMSSSTLDFGPKGLGPVDYEIFERQADLIRYYRDHNSMLRRRVVELSYQNSGRTPTLA